MLTAVLLRAALCCGDDAACSTAAAVRVACACTLAVACCALAVGHHWRPPRCDLAPWKTSATSAAEPLGLAIFWHIGAFEHRQARRCLGHHVVGDARQLECEL